MAANELNPWNYLSTGCSSIDKILHGGIPLNGITEICGCSGAGKTQLCLQLALTVQLPKELGGLGKCAAYIYTEGTFPIKRLAELASFMQDKYNTISFKDNVFIHHILGLVRTVSK